MKTYTIRMTTENIVRCRDGRKTQTRRLKQRWLKVRVGDHLRVLRSGGLILVVVENARLQPVQDLSVAEAIAECCPAIPGHHYRSSTFPENELFDVYWDHLHAGKRGKLIADNPNAVVLTFRALEANTGREATP